MADGINLLADDEEGINLLSDQMPAKAAAKQMSFSDLSKEDQGKAMDLARQQISAQYPNMPNWLRDMMLSITPKDASPRLQKIANEAQAQTNFIPTIAGGLMQGFATPFQGVASMIPGKITKDFANTDFTGYLSGPQNGDERLLQGASEIVGSLGPLGKLFGALKSGSAALKVHKALQNATALAGTGAIATPGDIGNKELGALGALALGGAGKVASKVASATAAKVPAFLRGLTNDSTVQTLVDAVQKPHDVLSNTADQLYDYVRGAIQRRKIATPVKQAYLNQATEILPKTRASQKLIADAKSGDYDAVHDLQSHLYKKGTKALASDDVAIENQGDEILELRNNINEELKNNLIQSGNVDIAHVLQQGRNVHKKMMETYFNKNLQKGIGKLVHPELRLVPENPENLFMQNSKPMRKFLQQHPEAEKHVKGIQEKEAAKKALRNMLITSGGIGGTTYLGKSLFDFLH